MPNLPDGVYPAVIDLVDETCDHGELAFHWNNGTVAILLATGSDIRVLRYLTPSMLRPMTEEQLQVSELCERSAGVIGWSSTPPVMHVFLYLHRKRALREKPLLVVHGANPVYKHFECYSTDQVVAGLFRDQVERIARSAGIDNIGRLANLGAPYKR